MNRTRVAALLRELGLTAAELRALADEIDAGRAPANDAPAPRKRRPLTAEDFARADRALKRAGVYPRGDRER